MLEWRIITQNKEKDNTEVLKCYNGEHKIKKKIILRFWNVRMEINKQKVQNKYKQTILENSPKNKELLLIIKGCWKKIRKW